MAIPVIGGIGGGATTPPTPTGFKVTPQVVTNAVNQCENCDSTNVVRGSAGYGVGLIFYACLNCGQIEILGNNPTTAGVDLLMQGTQSATLTTTAQIAKIAQLKASGGLGAKT